MDLNSIKWIDHAAFFTGIAGKTVYIDPFRLVGSYAKADIILITHPHFDHMSVDDIKKVATEKTRFFIPQDSVGKLPFKNVTGVAPNKSYSADGVEFGTMPAYNVKKDRLHYHPKENGWVGYVVKLDDGSMWYYAGDTDQIEDMHALKPELACIPMGGTYVMDVEEAVEASKSIQAKHTAPMHYKSLLGEAASKEAEARFRKNAHNAMVFDQVEKPFFSF